MPSTEIRRWPPNTVQHSSTLPRCRAAWIRVKQRRRPRGSTPSRRWRIHVSDGARAAPKGLRRFRASTGSPPPRACVSNTTASARSGPSAPAAARLRVELQQRRDLEGEHGQARHQAVGEADDMRDGRIGDAVETRAHRTEHPGQRQMLSEGIPGGHLTARLCLFCRSIAGPGRKSTKRSSERPRNRLIMNEKKI